MQLKTLIAASLLSLSIASGKWIENLHPKTQCIDYDVDTLELMQYQCIQNEVSENWTKVKVGKKFQLKSFEGLCIQADMGGSQHAVLSCNKTNTHQLWDTIGPHSPNGDNADFNYLCNDVGCFRADPDGTTLTIQSLPVKDDPTMLWKFISHP